MLRKLIHAITNCAIGSCIKKANGPSLPTQSASMPSEKNGTVLVEAVLSGGSQKHSDKAANIKSILDNNHSMGANVNIYWV